MAQESNVKYDESINNSLCLEGAEIVSEDLPDNLVVVHPSISSLEGCGLFVRIMSQFGSNFTCMQSMDLLPAWTGSNCSDFIVLELIRRSIWSLIIIQSTILELSFSYSTPIATSSLLFSQRQDSDPHWKFDRCWHAAATVGVMMSKHLKEKLRLSDGIESLNRWTKVWNRTC